MNRAASGSPKLWRVIFILMISIFDNKLFADEMDVIQQAEGVIDLHLCKDDRLGVELLCNRYWKQEVTKDAVLLTISEDPAVLLTVAKSQEAVLGLDELSEAKIKQLGQYNEGFKVEQVKIGDLQAIKVDGSSSAFPELRIMDYYVVYDYQLYSFLFSVNPKEEWASYAVLFSKILESIKIADGKN